MLISSRRTEQGSTAVLTAMLAVVLFGSAAIAVDLGNAVARKGDTQVQADFAALAGGAQLGDTAKVVTNPAVQAVAKYFVDNATRNDGSSPPNVGTVAANLVDGDAADGEVYFLSKYKMRVLSPTAQVDFGFAGIFNTSGVGVASDATVMVGTGAKTLPYYVADTCSYLQQTIVDPAPGQDEDYVPALNPPGDPTYTIKLDSTSPTGTPVGANPGLVTLNAQGGQAMDGVYKIGFTTENFSATDPSKHIEQQLLVPLTGGSSYSFNLPSDVYNTEGVWYIRVWKYNPTGPVPNPIPVNPPDTDGKWSADSVPFTVGSPPLYCQGSKSGNFGSLAISRSDSVKADWVAMNTALGVQHSLHVHPTKPAPTPCAGEPSSQMAPWPYAATTNPVNCLETEPGIVSQATQGLITGVNGNKGLLDTSVPGHETTCDPDGNTDDRKVNISGKGGFDLNNDVLTCFITNPAVSVGDVSKKSGAPNDVISPEIFSSPRFFYLPVLSDDPSNGRSGSWPIIDFRPAFLTGQPSSATPTNPMATETKAAENGVITDNNGIEKLRVVLLNDAAFPSSADLPVDVIEYIGVGTKVIRLVD